MGGLILLLILGLLIALLVMPALQARQKKLAPPPEEGPDGPHEVVVHRLDDHRKAKSATDEGHKP